MALFAVGDKVKVNEPNWDLYNGNYHGKQGVVVRLGGMASTQKAGRFQLYVVALDGVLKQAIIGEHHLERRNA